ncbi:hypothetical protein [Pseudoduganella namucuonensis]|uniref:Uncharacterized protein n=1 Tax=Pseudoduganella namucuonensis TaxID=1035707 RepID=A0A1I7L5D9_9BURK|nr:hypothetical protein [Pseudoduganella namucuonensis]SFV04901.1 hypothetical protein SAMN05216552_102373 [Pseudoduganella namucuonensis]
MIITIINHTDSIQDEELQTAIRAINRQITEDFAPHWGLSATLRLGGRSSTQPDKLNPPDMRGDAILYMWDQTDIPNALGYHDRNARGIPYGFVFTELADSLGEPWSVTLSHEALELLADPHVNLLVAGPHPSEDRTVFHWYEMSDAVQDETYEIDGVPVSNFVLPLYFTPDAEPGSRNDFLGRSHGATSLVSFGINPGGYIGFFDPQTGEHETYAMADDPVAMQRLATKKVQTASRRAHRTARASIDEILGRERITAKAAASVERRSSRKYEKIN